MSPAVDLVMMSKATSPDLAAVTQRAIDSAHAGAPGILNVYVLEQCVEWNYVGATRIPNAGPFNYNAACNKGAKQGNAPWIVFSNNDVRFEFGWADAMTSVGHPVMSPFNPGYHRHHVYSLHNETGTEVGRHLSGWCFMMARWLWEDLGGLDETYPFWCSDNAVMDQLRPKGIRPMLVMNSVVHHTVSMTLHREDAQEQDRLTWGAVHEYNQSAEHKACMGDFRYEAWKQRNGLA